MDSIRHLIHTVEDVRLANVVMGSADGEVLLIQQDDQHVIIRKADVWAFFESAAFMEDLMLEDLDEGL